MNTHKTTDELQVDLTPSTTNFDHFLSLPANDRIIFSGIFGIGKTHFLTNYFKNHSKFMPLHIFPTNYSVAQNEDIFELIKFDILYKLLFLENINLEKSEISHLQAVMFLNKEESYEIFKSFIKAIPHIGRKVVDIIKPLENLLKILKDKQDNLNTNVFEGIRDFASDIENKKGSIYENDFYTQLISKLIKSLKEIGTSRKEVVLIVDDLDRIDPEHIFRIINIFAVHFDIEGGNENKFGLDRIILCCDIKNIRNIFSNRYGDNVNFSGYIDKFYSREIYHFDNKQEIFQKIGEILNSITIAPPTREEYISWKGNNTIEYNFLSYILTCFVFSNNLNLRTLKRLTKLEYSCSEKRLKLKGSNDYISSFQIRICAVMDFLIYLFNDINTLARSINELKFIHNDSSDRSLLEKLSPMLIAIITYQKHYFSPSNSAFHPIDSAKYSIKTEYDPIHKIYSANFLSPQNVPGNHFKHILYEALMVYTKVSNNEITD